MAGTVTHSTFVVERTYPRPPQVVYEAIADPTKRRRWYAESDHHEVETYEADFRVGGADRLSYRFVGESPVKGMVITNEGRFENIVPNERVVLSSSMWMMDACISCSLVTMDLHPVDGGTLFRCTFQGAFFENSDGPQLREMGWNVLLDNLGREIA